jgi:hypothetical protein
MAAAFLIFAALLTSVPIIATVLVSVASRREDHEWTLAGQAPGTISLAARHVLGFHARGIGWLQHVGGRERCQY